VTAEATAPGDQPSAAVRETPEVEPPVGFGTTAIASEDVERGGAGAVTGTTTWRGIAPGDQRHVVVLVLVGTGANNRGKYVTTSAPLGEPFAFGKVPDGHYRLRAEIDFVRLWETDVLVRAGHETTVELTPDNSSVDATAFPPP
jgi:hypothetical protein